MTETRAPYATAQAAGHPLTLADFAGIELCAEIVELRTANADLRERLQELEQENTCLGEMLQSRDALCVQLYEALRQIAALKLHYHEGRCEARRIIDEALK